MTESVAWLLAGPPWVEYRARLDLLGQSDEDREVAAARQSMVSHQQIKALLAELAAWPGPPLKRHNDAGHLLHKLAFIADLGLRADDPGMDQLAERILSHRSPAGPFQIVVNVPAHFGGAGQDQYAWMLCDAPLVVYALLKLGLVNDARVRAALEFLVGLVRENGWPCAAAPEFGKFRGPGRKEDPCPYATLLMLKVLAQISAWRDSEPARIGATALLDLWESRKMRRPYLFALGTDFAKLKAPLIWFDVLHVLDVLTQFPWLWGDPRLLEMIEVVRAKADAHGRFTPESVWLAWKGWDFGQKRAPSEWLTFLVLRMLQRHATSVTYVSGCRGFGEVCSGSAGVSPAKGAGDAREPALPGSAAKE